MTRLISSELLQLRTIRSPLLMAGAWALATAVIVGLIGYLASLEELSSIYDRESAPRQIGLGFGVLLMPVIGIAIATTDVRQRTVGAMLLVEPRRDQLWAAKAVTAVGLGAVLGLLTGLLAGIALRLGMSLQGGDAPFELGNLIASALVVALVGALLGLFGLGFGGVLRNQTLAIVLALAFLLVIQSVLAILLAVAGLEEAGRWMPGALLGQVADLGIAREGSEFIEDGDSFSPGVATLIFAGYGVILSAIGAFRMRRTDIT